MTDHAAQAGSSYILRNDLAHAGRVAIAPSTPGRCIYCDERCEARATEHGYCREDFEREHRPQ